MRYGRCDVTRVKVATYFEQETVHVIYPHAVVKDTDYGSVLEARTTTLCGETSRSE